jgi:hypothetical protein
MGMPAMTLYENYEKEGCEEIAKIRRTAALARLSVRSACSHSFLKSAASPCSGSSFFVVHNFCG